MAGAGTLGVALIHCVGDTVPTTRCCADNAKGRKMAKITTKYKKRVGMERNGLTKICEGDQSCCKERQKQVKKRFFRD